MTQGLSTEQVTQLCTAMRHRESSTPVAADDSCAGCSNKGLHSWNEYVGRDMLTRHCSVQCVDELSGSWNQVHAKQDCKVNNIVCLQGPYHPKALEPHTCSNTEHITEHICLQILAGCCP